MRPKKIDLPIGQGWTWDRCQQFADRVHPTKSREPLEQQQEYARATGTECSAQLMAILYSKWSLAVEAQILSRTTEDMPPPNDADIVEHMGRGQAPKFKWSRLAKYQAPEGYMADPMAR